MASAAFVDRGPATGALSGQSNKARDRAGDVRGADPDPLDHGRSGIDHSVLTNCPSRGRHLHPPAEAGCLDRHFRPRLREIEPLPDQGGLDLFAATDQAFVQAVQAPDVVGMPARPAAATMRPQLASLPKKAVLTSGEVAIVLAI